MGGNKEEVSVVTAQWSLCLRAQRVEQEEIKKHMMCLYCDNIQRCIAVVFRQ